MSLSGERNLIWAVAAAATLADQGSKALIVRILPPGRSIAVIPGFFDLTLVTNTGGVFGLLRDVEGVWRGLLFSVVPLAVVAFVFGYGWRLPAGRAWARTALGLILGGALGNLVDRLRLGHVIDFLDAYAGPYHWPAFNLADSGICVGVAMLLVEGLLIRRAPEEVRGAPAPPTP